MREPEPSLLRRLDRLLFWEMRAAWEPRGDREGLCSRELVRRGFSLHQTDLVVNGAVGVGGIWVMGTC